MFHYKTVKCAGFPWNCQCNGMDWHRPEERRRGPVIRYAPVPCPDVKPFAHSEWGDPSGCPKGDACEFVHTLLELMYHPLVYKTGRCDHFSMPDDDDEETEPADNKETAELNELKHKETTLENDSTGWQCVWRRRCAHAHGKNDLRPKIDRSELMTEFREEDFLDDGNLTPQAAARLMPSAVSSSSASSSTMPAAYESLYAKGAEFSFAGAPQWIPGGGAPASDWHPQPIATRALFGGNEQAAAAAAAAAVMAARQQKTAAAANETVSRVSEADQVDSWRRRNETAARSSSGNGGSSRTTVAGLFSSLLGSALDFSRRTAPATPPPAGSSQKGAAPQPAAQQQPFRKELPASLKSLVRCPVSGEVFVDPVVLPCCGASISRRFAPSFGEQCRQCGSRCMLCGATVEVEGMVEEVLNAPMNKALAQIVLALSSSSL
eukprot:GABV01000116.1.p1 GENE.GABV01000116.1~~GABV01000116.1.p1  ORF type:complete len:435 (+),score=146.75 GABV01000116.1:587-1891(+)